MTAARKLTPAERCQMKSLMADSGYGAKEARELARLGFGELSEADVAAQLAAEREDRQTRKTGR